MFDITKILSNQCEHAKECPFYSSPACDNFYKLGLGCGIKREKDEGYSWEEISKSHHKIKF